jgi:hypothetical protein
MKCTKAAAQNGVPRYTNVCANVALVPYTSHMESEKRGVALGVKFDSGVLSAAQSPCLAVQHTHCRPSSSPISALSQWIVLHLGRHPVPRLSLLSVLLPASFCGPAQIRNRLHADRSCPTSSHEPGFGGPKHFVWLRRSLPTSGRGVFDLPFAAAKASRREQS